MYHLVTGLYAYYTQKPRYNVLLLGINGSGKTAWLDKVRSKMTRSTARSLRRFHPTVGQNVLDIHLPRVTLHFWDLGGEKSLRRIWKRYYEEANVLVWAMDSRDWAPLLSEGVESAYYDQEQIAMHTHKREECWQAFATLATHSTLTSLPLLFLVTHIDELDSDQATAFEGQIKDILQERLTGLAKAEDVRLQEELDQLDHSAQGKDSHSRIWNEWHVIIASAQDGTGVDSFVDWLSQHVKR